MEWTKENELGDSECAEYKGYAKVKNKKITYIKFHYNGVDKNINFGYGHTIRTGKSDLKDIRVDDKKIWNEYSLGKKNARWDNINSLNIWVPVSECNKRLDKDFKIIAKRIREDLPKLKLTQNQIDALIDFRYNVGSLDVGDPNVFEACKTNNPKNIKNAIEKYQNMDKNRRRRILERFGNCK